MKKILRRGLHDWRMVALLIPAVLILCTNMPVALTIGYSFSVAFIFAAASHLLRKVLFPYVDLRELVAHASCTPLGSAVVFLSVMIVLSSIMLAISLWLSH
ncbi:TPA: hypothetical protein QDB28_004011 [Burkholderia vietnamiensis]|nr:hypothetical protein [Burkholderia vietnamiensis]